MTTRRMAGWALVPVAALALGRARADEAAPGSVKAAEAAYLRSAATSLRAAYLAHVDDGARLMHLKAVGRPEIEAAVVHRVAGDARWEGTPVAVVEAASGDLAYAWGTYRLDFTRAAAGERITGYGRYLHLWRRTPKGWRLLLDHWAGEAAPPLAVAPSPGALGVAGAVAGGRLRGAQEAFLRRAEAEGIRTAFEAHLAPDGAILFLGAVGREAATAALAKLPADARVIAAPADVEVVEAAAGDLGYATGPYRFEATVDGRPVRSTGRFVTVWRRGADGVWRIAVDHGAQD